MSNLYPTLSGQTQNLKEFRDYCNDLIDATQFKTKLFRNNVTPSNSTVLSDLTEANFGGYTALTPGAHFNAIFTNSANNAEMDSGAVMTWTADGLTPNTIYGYYVVDTNGPTLLWVERFDNSADMTANGNELSVTLRYGMGPGTVAMGGGSTPECQMQLTASQPLITAVAVTQITGWEVGALGYDTDTMTTAAANTITITTAGDYQVWAVLHIVPAGVQLTQKFDGLKFFLNGVDTDTGTYVTHRPADGGYNLFIMWTPTLAANDAITIRLDIQLAGGGGQTQSDSVWGARLMS